jgi:hypothetical protein
MSLLPSRRSGASAFTALRRDVMTRHEDGRLDSLRMAPSAHSGDATINLMKISGISVKLLSEARFL